MTHVRYLVFLYLEVAFDICHETFWRQMMIQD